MKMTVSNILAWLHPAVDALFTREISFDCRWRLLAFQPIATLIYLMSAVPLWFSKVRYTIIRIPVRDHRQIRSLVYTPDASNPAADLQDLTNPAKSRSLRPLHLDIHGGGFIGGIPESNHRFCQTVSTRTGTIVVSTTYRFAPRHKFPSAIDDIDDVVSWLLENAETKLGADINRFTIGGSSAGGNLALAASLQQESRDNRIKAVITFYASIDVSTPPGMKPRPNSIPSWDPASFLFPLFDAYGASARPHHADDPRSSPYKAEAESLPPKILMIVPAIDILVAEQLAFAKRINQNSHSQGKEGKVEVIVMEDCFHGWLELPSLFIKETTRSTVFDRCIDFLKEVYR